MIETSGKQPKGKNKVTEVKTFPVPFKKMGIKENLTFNTINTALTQNNSGKTTLNSRAGQDVIIASSGSSLIFVSSSGDVGIGTTTPPKSENDQSIIQLTVAGDIRASGAI